MVEPTLPEKFSIVLGQTFDNIGIIIGELNAKGKTELIPDSVNALKTFVLSHDKIFTIDKFIKNSNKIWKDIKNRDEKCLLENCDQIFGDYSEYPEFDAVKLIFTSAIDDISKSYIWECLFSLVKLAITYIYIERGTSITRGDKDGKKIIKISYKNKDFFPEINLSEQNKLLDSKLW